MFRTIRIIMVLIIGVALSAFLWDKYVTQYQLPESQWEFQVDEPILDTLDGAWPPETSPHFRMEWRFANHSKDFVQTFQLNGELFRCDNIGQPLDTCDYITRFNRIQAVNLPAGRTTTRTDTLIFTQSTGVPGVLRARVWVSDVTADSDRKY